jgi:hypothetical protein
MKDDPYKTGRKPDSRTVRKFLPQLKQIAGGGKIPEDEDLAGQLPLWFGTDKPKMAQVAEFLEYVDLTPKPKKETGGASSATPAAAKAVKPAKGAKAATKPTGSPVAVLEQLRDRYKAEISALEAKIKSVEEVIAMASEDAA